MTIRDMLKHAGNANMDVLVRRGDIGITVFYGKIRELTGAEKFMDKFLHEWVFDNGRMEISY